MGIELSGIELENFKSYVDKQCISFSDLSVLLGANSSGKSTALQSLLIIKQTLECNSPDEDLLLSGKYVTVGDYDDVISDKEKGYFLLSAILKQTEKSENAADEDLNRITWKFERAEDGISAVLKSVEIEYENVTLSFLKSEDSYYYMYINGERIIYSARINNLCINRYLIHYDVDLNKKAVELINKISRILISNKTMPITTDTLVSVEGIQDFYFKLLDKIQDNEDNKSNDGRTEIDDAKNEFAERLCTLLYNYGELLTPGHEDNFRMLPRNINVNTLYLALLNVDDLAFLETIVSEHEEFLKEYNKKEHSIEDYNGKYIIRYDPFYQSRKDVRKDNRLIHIRYAIDIYEIFFERIIPKIFFVGPIRETPKGLYNIGFETIPKYVGPTGSYFPSVLLHENKKEREYILPDRKERCTLSEALAVWMIHLNVASFVNVDKKNSFGFSVSIENMEQVRSDIMNVGIGTSQVLPVLITVLLSEPNEILVFEQPELHLHPYSQSRLADMFTEFSKHGRKIILETHSEYFLLRLRYHIVKERFKNDKAAINFFQNTGGTKVTTANISGYGNIDYPKDFRDETQEILNAIMEASLDRKGLS